MNKKTLPLNPNFALETRIRRCSTRKMMHAKGGFNPDKRVQISARFEQSALRADFVLWTKSGLKLFLILFLINCWPNCLSSALAAEPLMDKFSSTRSNPFESQLPKPKPPEKKPEPPPKATGTTPPPTIQVARSQEQQKITAEQITQNLVITGWVWGSHRPQAIINGEVVDIGDTVSNMKIVAIRKSGIDFLYEGEIITITLK